MDITNILFFIEILGTIAFASSGAILGIQQKLDIFGVNVLGVTTAVGGGLIRDLILGRTPPGMFRDPRYTLAAVITSSFLFLYVWIRHEMFTGKIQLWYTRIMNFCDMLGLGIFTALGMNTAVAAGFEEHHFLIVFVGVLTGVGGGLLRDMMVSVTPYIFVKHVYAVASLCGALTILILMHFIPRYIAMVIGAMIVVIIRALASHYRWNLPRIQ